MKKIFILFTIALLSSPASADDIILVADPWCPFNCGRNDENPGYMVEIAKYVFEQHGHTVKYFNVPWARAIYGTREGQYDGIIGAGRTETPDFVFPDIELGLARHTFYVKKGNPWRYDGLDSLKTITLGVIKNYSYGDLYNVYIEPNQNNPKRIQVISGEKGLALNIQKLEENKIDAIIEYFFRGRYRICGKSLYRFFSKIEEGPGLRGNADQRHECFEKIQQAF